MKIDLKPVPTEYVVELEFDDPTRVESWDTIIERVTVPPPPPVPMTRRERDKMARLKWILDDLGLSIFTAEIMRRLEETS